MFPSFLFLQSYSVGQYLMNQENKENIKYNWGIKVVKMRGGNENVCQDCSRRVSGILLHRAFLNILVNKDTQ